MNRRIIQILLLLALLVSFPGCGPNIAVSTDPKDSDFSSFHPEIVQGDGFIIQPDVRVFTLYAFLNGVAGWDEENGERFSPERQALREALQERLAAVDPGKVNRWRKYYNDHKKIPFSYLYYTMTLGTPPEFSYIVPIGETERSGTIRSLDGFHTILAEFYTEAGLEELFTERFREMMMEGVRSYDAASINGQVDEVYRYTRLDRAAVEDFELVIIPNPFDTQRSAMSLGYQKRLYIVDGPANITSNLNIHEYLHKIMDEILPADLAGQEKKFSAMLKQNIDRPYVKDNYEEVGIFVEEALVRALDARIRIARDPNAAGRAERVIADEVANGLVLVDDFYLTLQDYEKDSGIRLRDFIAQALPKIPAQQ